MGYNFRKSIIALGVMPMERDSNGAGTDDGPGTTIQMDQKEIKATVPWQKGVQLLA